MDGQVFSQGRLPYEDEVLGEAVSEVQVAQRETKRFPMADAKRQIRVLLRRYAHAYTGYIDFVDKSILSNARIIPA